MGALGTYHAFLFYPCLQAHIRNTHCKSHSPQLAATEGHRGWGDLTVLQSPTMLSINAPQKTAAFFPFYVPT